MGKVTITNQTENLVRKYGQDIDPQSSLEYDTDIVLAYSAMEISRALRYINIKLGNIDRRLDNEAFYNIHARYNPKLQYVYVQNFEDIRLHDPWIVRKYKEWRENRRRNRR